MHLQDLPSRLLRDLCAVGKAASSDGVRLFVFGSFARGDARPNSDLDLGFEIATESPSRSAAIHRLQAGVANLPTIRPIELVDFDRVTPQFRAQASRMIVPLAG